MCEYRYLGFACSCAGEIWAKPCQAPTRGHFIKPGLAMCDKPVYHPLTKSPRRICRGCSSSKEWMFTDIFYITKLQARLQQMDAVRAKAQWVYFLSMSIREWEYITTRDLRPRLVDENIVVPQQTAAAIDQMHRLVEKSIDIDGLCLPVELPGRRDEVEGYNSDYELGGYEFGGMSPDELRHLVSRTYAASGDESEADEGENADGQQGSSQEGSDDKSDKSDDSDSEKDTGSSDDESEGQDSDETPDTTPDDENIVIGVQDPVAEDRVVGDISETINISDPDNEIEPPIMDLDEQQDLVAIIQATGGDRSGEDVDKDPDGEYHEPNHEDSEKSGEELEAPKDSDVIGDTYQSDNSHRGQTNAEQEKSSIGGLRTRPSRRSKKRKSKVSPPWRSAAADIPTTFEDELGRRKSGRIKFTKRE